MTVLTEDVRRMKGSPREIGSNEDREWVINVPADWGVPATPTTMEVFDANDNIITAASGGAPTISDQEITFNLIGTALRLGYVYKVRITFDLDDGQTRSVIGEWRVKL
jgi:hypothetical protein